jgi:alkanesulfonate monooxygenase SsuD/methylene tetrahydromethanopterin reductase-like flavin-dependent oxidoreductase (luciferase family)
MTRARAFRFGLFGESTRSPEALLQTARRAEDAGYSTFLIRDHFIAEPFGHQLAPLTVLATVAAATTSLRVGSLVLSNDYRHPVMLAKEIATLDVLSSGRVELGLGAGFSKVGGPDVGALARRRFLESRGQTDVASVEAWQADIAAALPPHLVRFERLAACGHAVLPDAPERALAVIRDFIAR